MFLFGYKKIGVSPYIIAQSERKGNKKQIIKFFFCRQKNLCFLFFFFFATYKWMKPRLSRLRPTASPLVTSFSLSNLHFLEFIPFLNHHGRSPEIWSNSLCNGWKVRHLVWWFRSNRCGRRTVTFPSILRVCEEGDRRRERENGEDEVC